jgi:hypothetical protein
MQNEDSRPIREESMLSVEILNSQPVELIDLTESLLSLSVEYKRFVARSTDLYIASDPKLYIKAIRSGSIYADLVAGIVPFVAPLWEQRESIGEYAKWLKNAYDYYKGLSKEKPALDKTSYQNLSTFLQPVAKDSAAQLNVNNTVNGQQTVNININSMEANAIQNLIRNDLALLKEPTARPYEKVVLYWYQAKNDPQSTTGDKGIIESIAPYPIKVVFMEDTLKTQMLYKDENPFKSAYIVDVVVETVDNKPVLYKVVGFHGPVAA